MVDVIVYPIVTAEQSIVQLTFHPPGQLAWLLWLHAITILSPCLIRPYSFLVFCLRPSWLLRLARRSCLLNSWNSILSHGGSCLSVARFMTWQWQSVRTPQKDTGNKRAISFIASRVIDSSVEISYMHETGTRIILIPNQVGTIPQGYRCDKKRPINFICSDANRRT